MTYNYHRHNSCSFCGCGDMRMVNAFAARCTECEGKIIHGKQRLVWPASSHATRCRYVQPWM